MKKKIGSFVLSLLIVIASFGGLGISASADSDSDNMQEITIVDGNAYCEVGQIGYISYSPDGTDIQWFSSDDNTVRILSVSDNSQCCNIQCLRPGTATITVTSYYFQSWWDPLYGAQGEYKPSEHTFAIHVRAPQCVLSLALITSDTATFDFDAPVGADSVILQQSVDNGQTWSPAATSNLDCNSTTASITGLTPRTYYIFKLSVTGGEKNGDSNTVAAFTEALVSGISLDKTKLSIVRGATCTLTATVLPSDAGNKQVNWSSSDPDIAAVINNNDGTATVTANANKTGKVNITATTAEGGFSQTCEVTVINPTPTVSIPSGNIDIGSTVTLSVPVSDVTIYYTLDGSTPTRNSTKYVSPIVITKSETLRAIAVGNDVYDSDVLSANYTAVQGVTGVSFGEPSYSLQMAKTFAPPLTVSPDNAFNKSVTYSSSDTSVFTVSDDGIVTGVGTGSATLTAKSVDGGFVGACTINITPIPIYTEADFEKIGVDQAYPLKGSYKLMNDITISSNDIFTPVGDFSGVFDGDGHKFTGINFTNMGWYVSSNLNSNNEVALFSNNKGTIKNLTVDGAIYYTFYNNGMTVGGLVSHNAGLISNCVSNIKIDCKNVHDYGSVGGIAATNDGNIEYCVNKGNISCSNDNSSGNDPSGLPLYIGGIAGSTNFANGGSIKYCCNRGDISGEASDNEILRSQIISGGIAGYNNIISNCYNTGSVTTKSFAKYGCFGMAYGATAEACSGGITGYGNVENSYNTGAVTATSSNTDDLQDSDIFYDSCAYAGGICGDKSTALYCYNTGLVSATATGRCRSSRADAIASTATNSFCLNNISDTDGSATMETDSALKQQSTYLGFDFNNVWAIDPNVNNGYPYLRKNAVVPAIAPAGLTVTDKTNTSVTLSWPAVTGAEGYYLYNGNTKTSSDPITSNTYTVTGLTNSTAYTFKVSSINAVDEESAQSTPLSVTTFAKMPNQFKVFSGIGGKVSNEANGHYEQGQSINISATPDSGYRFDYWSSSYGGTFADEHNPSTSFTMPDNDTTVVASFKPIPVSSISIKLNDSIGEGMTDTLAATIKPDEALNKTVTWSSSNQSIATVDQNGKVTAVKPGTAIITATAQDGSWAHADCTVTVTAKAVSSISIKSKPAKTTYGKGQPIDVTGCIITVNYSNGTSEDIAIEPTMVSGFDSTSSGIKTVTVNYGNKTTTFNVTVTADSPVTDTAVYGNTVGNVVNNGIAAQQGNCIYIQGNDNCIYKLNTDGTGLTKINSDKSCKINVIGDWIYYKNIADNSIYKIKTDGASKTRLCGDKCTDIAVVGDWIYYNLKSAAGIYKIKTDGTHRTKLSNDNCYDINVADDWIYYDIINGKGFYKIKTDGTGKVKLSNNAFGKFNVVGGWIYYNLDTAAGIYKIKTNGTGKIKLSSDDCYNINVADGWIYYDIYNGNGLYKIKTDGTGKTELGNDKCNWIDVVGDTIYYGVITNDNGDWYTYTMKTDGTGIKEVDTSPAQ